MMHVINAPAGQGAGHVMRKHNGHTVVTKINNMLHKNVQYLH